jgi:hypothetical protein
MSPRALMSMKLENSTQPKEWLFHEHEVGKFNTAQGVAIWKKKTYCISKEWRA